MQAGRQGEGRAHGELRIGELVADQVTQPGPLRGAEVAQQLAAESYRAGVRATSSSAARGATSRTAEAATTDAMPRAGVTASDVEDQQRSRAGAVVLVFGLALMVLSFRRMRGPVGNDRSST